MAGVVGDGGHVVRQRLDRRLVAVPYLAKTLRQAQQHARVNVVEVALPRPAQVTADHLPGERRDFTLEQLSEPVARGGIVGGLHEWEQNGIGAGRDEDSRCARFGVAVISLGGWLKREG